MMTLWTRLALAFALVAFHNGAAGFPAPPTPAEKQARAAKPDDAYPLRGILIVGNDHFPTDEIIELTGLELGQTVRPADFERAVRNLDRVGAFESYEFRYAPKGDGYEVTFTVQEVAELYPLRLEGFGVPDEQLHALLREKVTLFGPKVPPTGIMARRIGNTLQAFWTESGHDTKVVGRIEIGDDDEFVMLYQPQETIRTIAFTKFKNAQAISALDLQRKFNSVAMGAAYSEDRLQELLKHNVAPMYAEIGRLEVTFCPCEAKPDTDSEGLVVLIQVNEGEEYKFGDIQLPETQYIKPEELARVLDFEPGDTANLELVRATLQRIEDKFKRLGFLKARTEFQEKLDRENKAVNIAMRVRAGARYTFTKLSIEGLDIIAERAIKKRWGLKVGDPFNNEYPAFFLNRIRQENMFDNLSKTDWQMKINEIEKAVEIVLRFG
jgi:outer membrane protein assembly factor BamA